MAAVLVGGAFLSAFLRVVFDRLDSPQVSNYFRGRNLGEKLLNKLEVKLRSIEAAVDDAELKVRDPLVRDWLHEVKYAVFDAEDLLDEIQIEALKCELEAGSRASSSKVRDFDRKIESTMEQVLEKLELLLGQKGYLDLIIASSVGIGSIDVSQELASTSLLVERVMYARDDDKKMILDWMTSDIGNHNQISILSIVGMGGVGKTTLAQHVFNDLRIKQAGFDIKAWVCVSDDFDVFKVTRTILEAITEIHDDSRNLEMVLGRLKEKMFGRRFLLVLDDVCNENAQEWEVVQNALCYGHWSSKILVTTRSTKVAAIMRSDVHVLKHLDDDHWNTASYLHHLPSHLKKCFAFCALFPKDYEFDKDCLISLWMAEDILQCPKQIKSPKEIGELYFNELLSRSFFQQSSTNKTCFVMHDLLNDLAKFVCGDICFRLGVDKAQSIPKMTRHFSFVTNDYGYFDGFGSSYDATSLHTFMPTIGRMNPYGWHCKMSIHELFSKFKCLRFLSLSCCNDLKKVPDSVGNLKHLHSLDLSSTQIKKLPDSTCSLYNLQILKLNFCHNLEELPSNLYKLANLHRLELMQTNVRKVPMHLGKLKNLQMFMTLFDVGQSSESSIQMLGELSLCGELSIGELQKIVNPLDALAADLKTKIHLVKLGLKWNLNRNHCDSIKEREVLENLQPSKHLEKLSICNYGGTQFPSWLSSNSLLSVVSLSLEHCKYCLRLPPLGLLPFLKDLRINGLDGIVGIDVDFYGSSSYSFLSLETLSFSNMKEWEKWECKAVIGAFPRLQHLYIVGCPKLKEHLPKLLIYLNKLVIRDCKQLEVCAPMAPKIHELELVECGKLQFDYNPTTLKRLTVVGHNMEALLLESIRHIISNASLEFLQTYFCPNMNISMSCCYDFLVTLEITCGCDSLTTFPLDFFPKLCRLDLRSLNLKMISQEHTHNHLKHLSISLCPQFESFPNEGLSAPWLESFSIDGLENLKSVSKHMHILLPSLTHLRIHNCPKVESFSDGGLPSNLKKMDLSNCCKLIPSLKEALGANSSLESLSIKKVDVESFPDEGLLPISLIDLEICNCLDLRKLDFKGLCHLTSLKKLVLSSCPSLQFLPEEVLPKSISCLAIRGCPFM